MKYVFVLLVLCFALFANEIKEKKNDLSSLDKHHLKSIHNNLLSKEELAYQKYKEELEKENQKLEDDGFCSCNNN